MSTRGRNQTADDIYLAECDKKIEELRKECEAIKNNAGGKNFSKESGYSAIYNKMTAQISRKNTRLKEINAR